MNKAIITGVKESFTAKILVKKICEAGIGCAFVLSDVNTLNPKLEGTDLAIIYMEEGEIPGDDVLRFLSDRMSDGDRHIMIIGADNDIMYVTGKVSERCIYKTFVRPVDNTEFVNAVRELLSKVESGEFKPSILVVDDDPNFLGLIREWLKGSFKINAVSSGMQAIKWLGKNKADLILLDYEMPVTTGPQVFEMLRSDDETKDIPVMFLTGKSDRESVMAVLALKPDGYFLKSIDKSELIERLEEFFIRRKA